MAQAEIGALRVTLGLNAGEFRRGLSKSEVAVQRFKKRTLAALGVTSKSLERLNVKGLFAGIASAAAATATIKGLIDTNRQFQSLKATLETFTGSASAASDAFEVLQDFASRTPFDLRDLTQAFNRMLSVGLKPSVKSLEAFGNVASGSSKSIIDFVEAVADASVGEFERLKEFGIKASKQGENVAFTFKGATEVVGNSATEIEGFLTRLGQTEFSGAMERQAQTIGGAFSNLSDNFDKLFVTIGEAGFNEALIEFAKSLSNLAAGSDSAGQAIGRFLGSGVNALEKTLTGAARAAQFARDNVDLLRQIFVSLIAMNVASRVVAIGVAFVNLAKAVRAAGIVSFAFQKIQRASLTTFLLVAAGAATLTGNLEAFTGVMDNLADKVKDVLPQLGDGIKNALRSAGFDLSALEGEINKVGDSLDRDFNLTGLQAVAAATKLSADAQREQNALLREGQIVFEQTRTPMEAFALETQRLSELQRKGAIDANTFARANSQAVATTANAYLGLASEAAGALGTLFGESKGFAIAQAVINTAQAITATLAQYGATPWGLAAAGVAAAAGAAQIAAIRSTSKSGGGSTSSPGGSGAAAGVSTSAGTAASAGQQQAIFIEGISDGDLFSGERLDGLIDSINERLVDGVTLVAA